MNAKKLEEQFYGTLDESEQEVINATIISKEEFEKNGILKFIVEV